MAGRFKVITDEHWSKPHIKAVREAGWEVVRVQRTCQATTQFAIRRGAPGAGCSRTCQVGGFSNGADVTPEPGSGYQFPRVVP